MRTAFSNALYYPKIDIGNINWLKTAILFWDSISTIVPESIRTPYQSRDTEYLADIEFLRPLRVNSEDRSVVGIENDIIELMYSPPILEILTSPNSRELSRVFGSKMSYRMRHNIELILKGDKIYADKMSWKVIDELHNINHRFNRDELYYLGDEFVSLYMIILANKLCNDHGLGMVTDNIPCFGVGNTVRLGNQTSILPDQHLSDRHSGDHQLEQGILLDYIIRGLSISPETDFEDLVKFKEHHSAELGRFRTQLTKLTQGINMDKPIGLIQNEIGDLYRNEFVPAFDDFQAALKGAQIKSITNTLLKVSLLSVSTTETLSIMSLPIEQALFASAGVSVITSAVLYNVDKKTALRENPYSYLLSVKQTWG